MESMPLKFNSMITRHVCVCLHWKVYFGLCTLVQITLVRLWKFWCTANKSIAIVSDNMRDMAIKYGTKLFLT